MVRTTVVIPNYNGMKYIDNCLKSLRQSSVPVKIILVDNASKDGSLTFVKKHYPEVSIIAFTVIFKDNIIPSFVFAVALLCISLFTVAYMCYLAVNNDFYFQLIIIIFYLLRRILYETNTTGYENWNC